MTDRLKKYCEFGMPALVIGGYVFVAAQRIGAAPVPDDGDESMILQVPYEIINRGKFAWPMYRYLGGNIENLWHSFRPVYYLLLTGFFKVFGWGLTQGRVFNLTTAALTLVMVYLVGRRLFGWRAGLVAVVMLVSDQTFFERSRMIRNEYPAAVFALLAFYFYEIAEERRSGRFYVASGLAAGAGVMVHTNLLYVLGAIFLLMLMRKGARVFVDKPLYQFGGAAFLVMAYEIVSDVLDYRNVRLQYQGDRAHFSISSPAAMFDNLMMEPRRYKWWYRGGELIFGGSPVLLHIFQVLTAASLLYLLIVCIRKIRLGNALADPRTRVLVVTAAAVLFLALVTGSRRKYVIYMANVAPWFALCVGAAVQDGLDFLRRWRSEARNGPRLAANATAGLLAVGLICYGLLFLRQNYRYYKVLNDPDHASFQEFSAVLRSFVPEGVCPISVVRPVIWLVFPESDRCYATIEGRMPVPVDIGGKDYALITASKKNPDWMEDQDSRYHLLGGMDGTPYGDIRVYYTGTDAELASIKARRYEFFGNHRGYVEMSPEALKP
jgi:4-amino-4-deoxy-L-arabinose transferase-like glycosyltransferase